MNNPFINYAQRSYIAIKTAIIDKIKNPISGIPEITDYGEGNDFIKEVGIWSGLSEQMGYYLNKKARERFIITCRKYESMVKHAKSHDYRIHGVNPSSGTVTFTTDAPTTAPINIPAGTKLNTPQGLEFLTLEPVVIQIGQSEIEANVKQWTLVPQFTWGQSTGVINQQIVLDENVIDTSIVVTVAGNQLFTAVDTFAYSKPEDRVYVPGLNEDKKMVIFFGDDKTGEIPQSAADIELSYYTSLGSDGNTPSKSITEIISVISVPVGIELSVNNDLQTNGGADVESLEELRVNIPLANRTKYRAVTDQDFIDIAKLVPGVSNATVSYNPDTSVTSYVVPVGGGIASSVLLQQVEDFFISKKAIQTVVRAQSVGEVRLVLSIIINVLTGYSQQDTINLVRDNLLQFLSWEEADINGKLVLGDLYQIMEETTGVLNSQILSTNIIPYPSPQNVDTIQLNWVIEVLDAGLEIETYKIQFTDTNNYNLFKNNNFINSYTVDNEIDTGEIKFTIYSDLYIINDTYIFKTYPKPDLNAGIIVLDEFSIIISRTEDLTIVGTGGIV